MPDLERGAAMWEALLKEGLYVNLARPPATPAGMTLLRCSLCAEHSSEEVETILGMFERAGRAVGIIKRSLISGGSTAEQIINRRRPEALGRLAVCVERRLEARVTHQYFAGLLVKVMIGRVLVRDA